MSGYRHPGPTNTARLDGHTAFWFQQIGGVPEPQNPLRGDTHADVCIVGAGFTGLWTAWYLKQHTPELHIRIVEQAFAGFGASGRNGGWLTGSFEWNHARYARTHGKGAVRDMVGALAASVSEILSVAQSLAIQADIRPTEELLVATTPAQLQRASAELAHRRAWGTSEGTLRLLSASEAHSRVRIPNLLGALCLQGVARIQPAKLVRGLADAVRNCGVQVHEATAATRIVPGRVHTARGSITARHVLRATEGFTATLPGHRRDWLPLNSAQIVTEPLPESIWADIGWHNAELLGDLHHSYCYCQRTADGRIAVGGRGVPYRFASALDNDGAPDSTSVKRLQAILNRMFPAAAQCRIEHAWCGVLGVPRDWCATVTYNPDTGLGHAGGYVGVGVASSNLAARTLADLVLARPSPLVALPWVNHAVRRWEPEPLRYLGVRGMHRLLEAADRRERGSLTGGRTSRLALWADRLAGR